MAVQNYLKKFGFLFIVLVCFERISFATSIVHHEIDLSIDLPNKKISGKDSVVLDVMEPEVPILLANRIVVTSITSGSGQVHFSKMETRTGPDGKPESAAWTSYLVQLPEGSIGRQITLLFKYEGTYPEIDFDNEKQNYGPEIGGYLNNRSGLLLDNAYWYPEIQGQTSLFTYQLRVRLEKGLAVISSGTRTETDGVVGFKMEYPTDGINLIFGSYFITKARYHDIELSTYFTKDRPKLAEAYLNKMKQYLKWDECNVGAYPYKRLDVVDSPVMVGLGFPQFTLIGEKLLTVSDIINTSLRHEILHNWYGSGIYVAPGSGNWTEGLVTYLADHQFNIKKIGQSAARLGLLRQYTVATRGKPEKSLNEVSDEDAPEDRAVAYSKSAMIFSMLESRIGKLRFYKGLRAFTREKMYHAASWDDFKKAFESESGQNLDPFFKQWIYRKGAPQVTLKLEKSRPHILLTPFSVSFTLHIDPLYQMDLPIEIRTDTKVVKKTVSVTQTDQKVFLILPSLAKEITVDPDSLVMRRLNANELPSNISFVLKTPLELSVLYSKSISRESKEFYETFLKTLELKFVEIEELKQAKGPVIILGTPDQDQRIGGWNPENVPWHWQKDSLSIREVSIQGGKDSAVISWYGPAGYSEPIIWIVGYSAEGLHSLAQRLEYYLSWSYVLFREGKPVVRGEWEKQSGTLSLPVLD